MYVHIICIYIMQIEKRYIYIYIYAIYTDICTKMHMYIIYSEDAILYIVR